MIENRPPRQNRNRRDGRVLTAAAVLVVVAGLLLAGPELALLRNLSIAGDAKAISGVTMFLNDLKGYLVSICLGGISVAGVAVAAAKFAGHSRANDMIFNIGVGIAILAAIPTVVA